MSMQSETGDFSPSDFIKHIIRWWWLAIVFMVAGGFGGYLVSFFRAPIYESNAEITTAIDYAYSGRLTDYEEDHLITAIGDVIDSSEVMAQVASEISSRGLSANPGELLRHLTLARQGYRWLLSSRYSDPYLAREVNEIWTQSALTSLQDLKLRALHGLQEYLFQQNFETCFSQAVMLDPVAGYCSVEDIQDLQKMIAAGEPAEVNSLVNSLHLSATSYQLTRAPDLPSEGQRYNVNTLVLSGLIIGLMAAVLFFLAGFPKGCQQR